MVDVDAMTVSQLRAYLREAGADTSSCFEKVSPVRGVALCHLRRTPTGRAAPRCDHAPSRRSTVAPSDALTNRIPSPSIPQSDLVRLAKKVAREGGAPGGGAGPSTARGRGSASSSGARKPEPHDPNAGRSTPPRSRRSSWRESPAPRTTTSSSASASPRARMRSSARTASSRSSCIDKNTAPGAEEAFKKVNKAWDVLSDKNKRATYDNFGAEAAEGRPGAGGNPFGGFGGGGFPGGGFPGRRVVSTAFRSRRFSGSSNARGAWEAWGRRFSRGRVWVRQPPGRRRERAGCQTSTYVPSCPTSPLKR